MIRVMVLPGQKIWGTGAFRESLTPPAGMVVASCDGVHAVRRAIFDSDARVVVCSTRPDIVWNQPLIERISRAVAVQAERGDEWLAVCADGVDLDGRWLAAAFFDREPSLLPDRGMQAIVQSAGTLVVLNAGAIRTMAGAPRPGNDLQSLINCLIVYGWRARLPAYFSPDLFPVFSGNGSLGYASNEEHIANVLGGMRLAQDRESEPDALDVVNFIENARDFVKTLRQKTTLSFVVRTLFRRDHLLRRCLISIDYLRVSLDAEVEVVLSTDVPSERAQDQIGILAREFPHLAFIHADGRHYPGFSRVRNLVAGIASTTGDHVAIIDDDDFYTPDAIVPFRAAVDAGEPVLTVFDTQVVNEKWYMNDNKIERQLLSYGGRYEAAGWFYTLRGSNSIPLCGVIHPGRFVREVIAEYDFRYDLSEDFVLHLLVFSHRNRPRLHLVPQLGAFQSHRAKDDNVSNLEDRTPWVVDVGNGLHQLLIEQGRTFETILGGEAQGLAIERRDELAQLRNELQRARTAHAEAVMQLALASGRLASSVGTDAALRSDSATNAGHAGASQTRKDRGGASQNSGRLRRFGL